MWYKKNYVRHLIDMHIADWSDEFLSEFKVENYIQALKKGRIQNAMIYLQSHVGLCNFPTKVGVMHKAFRGKEDTMKRLIDGCHEEGIAVTLYYSLNYNTLEHDRHEEFRALTEHGMSVRAGGMASDSQAKNQIFASPKRARYGICCPNSMPYRQFTYEQIDEMLEYAGEVEGVFFDMPFWDHTCYCDNCKARFLKEVGRELPSNYNDLTFMQKKAEWMAEWIQSVTDHVKERNPKISVEHNFSAAISLDTGSGCAEGVAKACDFLGGDLYGGILNHSFSCKFFKNITPNMPFDYMFSRCKPGLRYHTLTKTDDEIRTEIFMNTAHNGATLVIDAIDPVGTMDMRFYDKLGKIIDEEIEYEPYLNGEMVEDIGLYFSLMSKHNERGEAYTNKSALVEVSKTLIGEHIPFGVTGNFHRLEGYKLLIAPMLSVLEKDVDRIVDYVENGGNIYLSGGDNPELLYRLTGLKVVGETAEKAIYIAPEKDEGFLYFNKKYPLAFEGTAPYVKATRKIDVLATLTLPYTRPDQFEFASIHSDPPGKNTEYPAIISATCGKGRVVWSALPIEAIDYCEYREIFMGLLKPMLLGYKPSFKSDAPDTVEITLFEENDGLRVNLITVDEKPYAREIAPFTVSVKIDKKPQRVISLPQKEELKFDFDGGYVTVKVENFKIYNMFKIEI